MAWDFFAEMLMSAPESESIRKSPNRFRWRTAIENGRDYPAKVRTAAVSRVTTGSRRIGRIRRRCRAIPDRWKWTWLGGEGVCEVILSRWPLAGGPLLARGKG